MLIELRIEERVEWLISSSRTGSVLVLVGDDVGETITEVGGELVLVAEPSGEVALAVKSTSVPIAKICVIRKPHNQDSFLSEVGPRPILMATSADGKRVTLTPRGLAVVKMSKKAS